MSKVKSMTLIIKSTSLIDKTMALFDKTKPMIALLGPCLVAYFVCSASRASKASNLSR